MLLIRVITEMLPIKKTKITGYSKFVTILDKWLWLLITPFAASQHRDWLNMTSERVKQKLNQQASKMVKIGNDILPPVKVSDNILVAILLVDLVRGDAANLLAVIVEKKNLKIRIATKEGVFNT